MSVKKYYGKSIKNIEREDRVTEDGKREVNLKLEFDNPNAQKAVYNLFRIIEEIKDREIITENLMAADGSWVFGYIECLKISKFIDDEQYKQIADIVYLMIHHLEKKLNKEDTSDKKIQYWSDTDIANNYIDRCAYLGDEKAHKEAKAFEKEIIRRFVNEHNEGLIIDYVAGEGEFVDYMDVIESESR